MRSAAARLLATVGLVALVTVCLTVLAALHVVDGNRVVDVLSIMLPAAAGGWLGAKGRNGDSGGWSLRPPPKLETFEVPRVEAPYPKERP